jgi:hypothetical protein
MFSRNCWYAVVLVSIAASAKAGPIVVGGFDEARGGFESLASGEDSALAGDIASAYPGTTFQFANTLTPSFLNSVNVVILGVATSDVSAITPLTASEQTALLNFVLGGGMALIFADNSLFDPNAPAANASLLSPFGVTVRWYRDGSCDRANFEPGWPAHGAIHSSHTVRDQLPRILQRHRRRCRTCGS